MNVRVLPGPWARHRARTRSSRNVDDRDHELEFDALLVCTGASPFVPAVRAARRQPGADDAAGVRAARPARAPGRAGRRPDRVRVRRLLLALRLARDARLGPRSAPAERRPRPGRGARGGVPAPRHGRDRERPRLRDRHRGGRRRPARPRGRARPRRARTSCSASGCGPNTQRLGPRGGGCRVRRPRHAPGRRVLPHERRPRLRVRRRHRPGDAREHGGRARPHGRAARARASRSSRSPTPASRGACSPGPRSRRPGSRSARRGSTASRCG